MTAVLRGSVSERNGMLVLKSPYAWAAKARALPGAIWNPEEKVWLYPDTPVHREMIRTAFGSMVTGCSINPPVSQHVERWHFRNDPIPVTRTEPWKHQCEAYWFIKDKPAAALFMDMGTGKSKVVIDEMNNYYCPNTLILCPLSVISAWEKQFSLHDMRGATLYPLRDNLSSLKKADVIRAHYIQGAHIATHTSVFILNYEAAWRPALAQVILERHWDLVVLDEGHRIKAHKGKASAFCMELGRVARKRRLLTGTPMPHSPLDIYAQYRFLDPGILGPSYYPFERRYAVKGGFDNKEVVAFQNLEELNAKIYSIAYRVEAANVLDLPPYQHIERRILLGGSAWKHYRQLERQFITEISGGTVTAANALVKALRLQQLTSGFLTNEAGEDVHVHEEKEAALQEILEDTNEPIVVFCRFRRDLSRVRAVAAKVGRDACELSGRANDLAKWQSGGNAVLAVQWQAGGVGIDLSRSRIAVMYSTGFSLGDYEQALARLHRPGQIRPVTYYHLIAENTIDRTVYNALQTKRDVVDAVMNLGKE